MLIRCEGIIKFNPENKTRKQERQSTWKQVAVALTGDDLAEYYAWFIKRRYNLQLNKPIRGTHVTFINDRDTEVPLFERAQRLYDGKSLEFFIDPSPRTNGDHWWLRVWSPQAERIRKTAGGVPEPYFGLHLTLGYANEKNLAHSQYIHRCCKRYEPSVESKRGKLTDYELYKF